MLLLTANKSLLVAAECFALPYAWFCFVDWCFRRRKVRWRSNAAWVLVIAIVMQLLVWYLVMRG